MKKYYVVPVESMPPEMHVGEYHYIDLESHGVAGAGYHALVVVNPTGPVPESWHELPHLLDPETTLAHPKHVRHLELLANVGVKDAHTGYALAKHLSTIHVAFKP